MKQLGYLLIWSLLIAGPAAGQTASGGPYRIENSAVAAGGEGSDTAGILILSGAASHLPGTPSSGGDFSMTGGFWATQVVPTIVFYSVGGRVTRDPSGKGLADVRVTLTGGLLSSPLQTSTISRGYYNFPEVQAGYIYTVTVYRRNFVFAPESHTFFLDTNKTNLNFTASHAR